MDRVTGYTERHPKRVALALALAFTGVLAHQATAVPQATTSIRSYNCSVTAYGGVINIDRTVRGGSITVRVYSGAFRGQPGRLHITVTRGIIRGTRQSYVPVTINTTPLDNGRTFFATTTVKLNTTRGPRTGTHKSNGVTGRCR